MEQDIFEDGFHKFFGPGRDRHGNSKRTADGLVFSEQDPKDDTVDAGILAVIRDHPNFLARLPIAVNAAFPLFMTSRVPRQIVMKDGIEVILQVDAFAEAVGRHQYTLRKLGQRADAVLALGWSEFTGNTGDLGTARDFAAGTKSGGDVLGGLDEAAKDNRLMTVLEKRGDYADRSGELRIPFALETSAVRAIS
jgi:hypothetical protein